MLSIRSCGHVARRRDACIIITSRMAQTTKWLQAIAIRNCMKMVKLNISTVSYFLLTTANLQLNHTH